MWWLGITATTSRLGRYHQPFFFQRFAQRPHMLQESSMRSTKPSDKGVSSLNAGVVTDMFLAGQCKASYHTGMKAN
jgi:hypothetical protein